MLLRRLKWIAGNSSARYGPGIRCRSVRVSPPYLVLFVVFDDGVLTHSNECCFRAEPLEDEKKDELFYPALLNCSRFAPPEERPLSWICTQNVDPGVLRKERSLSKRMQKGLSMLCQCLLETGFNYSSEDHEYASWFTESKKVDPRLSTIEKWQETTENDPLFVLDVPWLKTGKTVDQMIDRIFSICGKRRRKIRTA